MAYVYACNYDLYENDDGRLVPFLGIQYGELKGYTGSELTTFNAKFSAVSDIIEGLKSAGTLTVTELEGTNSIAKTRVYTFTTEVAETYFQDIKDTENAEITASIVADEKVTVTPNFWTDRTP